MGRSRRQPRRPRLSLCLIARDEAAFLDRCLASIRDLVDERIVVDTGSVDETPAVARRHEARVYPFAWQDDFAAARNFGLARTRGDWVLVLDCDELLSPRDHQAVLQAIATREFDAYRMTTRNYTAQGNRAGWVPCVPGEPEAEGQAGWFPSTKVRLWRRRPGVRFEGAVHELVEPSLLRGKARIGDCPVPVHHYGYAGKPRNPELYLRAGERKVRDNPADLRAWYELAIACRDAGRLEEALAAGERVIAALDTTAEPAGLYLDDELARLVHADLLLRLGRLEEALAAHDALLARHPGSADALNNRGLVLEKLGRLAEARDSFARGAGLAPDNRVLAGNLARLTARGGHGPNGLSQRVPGPRLSVCVIARNEERVLGRCLESVRPVADELIVVDTGSTDGTREIAAGLGARLGDFPWVDDFAAARNASLDLATGDWILWLDADDYLLPVDLERLRRLKRLAPEQAFYCTLVNEGADRSAFRQVKLFPRRPGVRFERPVHETAAPSLERLGIPIRAIDLEVRHTGYADPEVAARKRRYYLELMKGWLAGHPDDWYLGFRVGHTHYVAGEHRRAREEFAALLGRAGGNPAAATAAGLALLFTGRSWLEEGQIEAALPFLERAAALRPDDALTLLSLGDARTKLRRYGEAITSLRAALNGRLDPFLPLDAAMVGYSTRFFLGQALQALGERAEAEAALVEAERLIPDRPEARQALAVLRGASSPTAAPATAPGPPRLSLCMIVRNEEARLARCLESARGAVDEIVVVDTGSTDRTVEIARGFGARLGHFPWIDDFAAARNASLDLATGDWILWLDADDLLPAEAHPRIRELIGQGRDRGYFFVLDDQGYENVSCLQLRLFPNLPGVRFEMPIHEQVTPSLARLGVRLVPTDLRVVHTGYVTPEVVRAKKERYLGIMERWLERHPGDYIVRSHVALTYYSTGRLDEAVAAYRAILFESTCLQDRNYVVYTTALLFLARTYLRQGNLDQALDFAQQAEAVDPDYQLTRLSLAEIQVRRQEYAQALEAARAVLSARPQLTFFPVDQREVTYSAHLVCGQAQAGLGDLEGAERAFREAAAVPVARRSQALGALSELLRGRGERTRALAVLHEALAVDPGNAQHLFNLGALHLEQKAFDEAAGSFRRVLEVDPGSLSARLNLGFIAKVQGRLDEAERIYTEAVALDQHGVEARANLGHLLFDQERHAEAAAQFREARARRSGLADVDLGLLAAGGYAADWATGQVLLEEILTAFPEAPWTPAELAAPGPAARVLARLAAILLHRNQPRCAELAMAGAVTLDPEYREGRRGLAEFYLARGALWKAVTQFEALITRDPGDRAAFRRLGDCYRQLGAADAARLCYDRAGAAEADGP